MPFVSNKLTIDMNAAFNKRNSKQTEFKRVYYMWITYSQWIFSKIGNDVQVNPGDALEDRNCGISFFGFQNNLKASLLDKRILKSTIHTLKLFLNLPHYTLSTDKKTV